MGNWWYGNGSMMGYGSGYGFGGGPGWFFGGPLLVLLLLWSLFWKGLALWHSGRRGKTWWFVALLVLNTLGILDIIYLFGFAKLKFKELFTMKR